MFSLKLNAPYFLEEKLDIPLADAFLLELNDKIRL